jgi:hypothetical protein
MFKKRLEKDLGFVNVGKEIIAVPGIVFLCIRDVVMKGSAGEVVYTKGKIYRSESRGSLTDNEGSTNHGASNDFLAEYFKVKMYNK